MSKNGHVINSIHVINSTDNVQHIAEILSNFGAALSQGPLSLLPCHLRPFDDRAQKRIATPARTNSLRDFEGWLDNIRINA